MEILAVRGLGLDEHLGAIVLPHGPVALGRLAHDLHALNIRLRADVGDVEGLVIVADTHNRSVAWGLAGCGIAEFKPRRGRPFGIIDAAVE
jgi:hypothetical protein